MRLQLSLLASFIGAALAQQSPWIYNTNGKPKVMLEVGRLPALGCKSHKSRALLIVLDNTWNAYHCDINETVVLENAKFMNDSGLLKAGYDYFCLDGMCGCE